MFSGIIEGNQKAQIVIKTSGGIRMQIHKPVGWKLKNGDSISIDGVCSTVEKIAKDSFTVFYMPETLKKTTLGSAGNNHQFNLEIPLTLNTLIGGHLVSGHIDTTATVQKITDEKNSKILEFKISPKFTKYIIYKGSITVNGVSLTVVTETKNSFSVSLIPYTLANTNLGTLKKGDKVNIELDLVAKYLEKLVR